MNRHEYKTLGKFVGAAPVLTANASPVNHHRAMSEELKAAYSRIEELTATLGECREYFEERADADCDQDGFIPNEEMSLLVEIDEVLL